MVAGIFPVAVRFLDDARVQVRRCDSRLGSSRTCRLLQITASRENGSGEPFSSSRRWHLPFLSFMTPQGLDWNKISQELREIAEIFKEESPLILPEAA